jgi:uncharacterized protein YkwD
VRSRLAGPGRPRLSGALVLAARALARRAAQGVAHPLDRRAVRAALAEGLAYDPAPAAFLARAGPARLRQALVQAITETTASHVGVGVAEAADGGIAVVVLASVRKLRLDPFPRDPPAGGSADLSGELQAGLRLPRVFVTPPSGQVQEHEAHGTATFRAAVPLGGPGRYLVEVVADGPSGPTVAALMAVGVGGASLAEPDGGGAEAEDPADPSAIEAGVVNALARLRAAHGLPPLRVSADLSGVARRHSAAMRAAGAVAHLVPGSPGPAERLATARVPYRRVFENVAAARTGADAQDAAAESPAHLQNMLQPEVSQVGVGVAREILPSGDPRIYLTEIFVQPAGDPDDARIGPEVRVREALWRERERLGLPPLTADAVLDELAAQGADELRRRDARELPDLAPRALELKRALAAADGFVASATEEVTRSKNLRDRRFRRVGVGVVEGSSRRFGAGRLFIAVIYTD